jgi:dihydroorotate dehydrogenase electron transfer subunit
MSVNKPGGEVSQHNPNGPFDTVATVVRQAPSGATAYCITLHCPDIARAAKAPQFFTMACRPLQVSSQTAHAEDIPLDPLLRRPLGFYRVSPENGEFDAVYKVAGRGTQLMTGLKPGDRVRVLGPLGNYVVPEDVKSGTVLLVGGGVGLPPLFFLAEILQRAGKEPIVIVGARSKQTLIAPAAAQTLKCPVGGIRQVESLEPFVERYIDCAVALEQPENGFFEGLVTVPLGKYLALKYENGVEIFTCGNAAMMKAVATMAAQKNIKCTVIMESRMGCAIGACQTCVVKTTAGYKRVCIEGPVFDAKDIVWE